MRVRAVAPYVGSSILASLLFAALPLPKVQEVRAASARSHQPRYTSDGQMLAPEDYREWIFLTSGFDMSYRERTPGIPEHSVFDNVFVNPEAYASFLKTGTWPDKTIMILENRSARSKGETLVKGGRFQDVDLDGFEIHVKDASRFKRDGVGGQWAFFGGFKDGKGKLFPATATCYTCHAEHAAVDTTFVQFYPTILGLAEKKGTLSEAYRKERDASRSLEPAAPAK